MKFQMVCLVPLLTIVAVLGKPNRDYITSLLEIDESIYGLNEEEYINLSERTLVRLARQTAGTTTICVPTGTCITTVNGTTTPGGGIIDPRIVTPGQTTAPPVVPPTTCPTGQQLCTGVAGAAACGQRYITTVGTADGTVTVPGAYPWQAFILNQTGYTGSGVLIDTLHVLTAAHKVNLNVATPGNIQVFMGIYNPNNRTQAQMRTAVSVTLHEQFNASTLRNDIAIIRLNAPIALGYQFNIGTACLPASTAGYVGSRCVVSGWGRSGFTINDAPTPQKQVTVPIVSYAVCRASMMQATVLGTNTDIYLDANGEVCAGGEANRDACTQDGGSPLVCQDVNGRFTIAGLVIWGRNCGLPGVYGVYVDVPKYRAWIDTNVARLNAG